MLGPYGLGLGKYAQRIGVAPLGDQPLNIAHQLHHALIRRAGIRRQTLHDASIPRVRRCNGGALSLSFGSMQPPDIVNLFAVPVAFSRHPAPAPLNKSLKEHLCALEQTGRSANPRPLTQRNAAVFESNFDLFRDPNPAVQSLKAFCWEQLLSVVGRLNGYDHPTLMRLGIYNDCWFHITRRGGFFGLHNHPNSSWSGVYCVDPGRPDSGNKASGSLSFINPMIAGAMHMDAGVAKMRLPYACQIGGVSLEPGQLVLFPSWLLHEVKPFEGDGERITIAFNCWFTLPDAQPGQSDQSTPAINPGSRSV
jgi:uncharacterized protein (TIGR02466 family)